MSGGDLIETNADTYHGNQNKTFGAVFAAPNVVFAPFTSKYILSEYNNKERRYDIIIFRNLIKSHVPIPRHGYSDIERNSSNMKITVCIGSSCHIKGSRQIVQRLQELIAQHKLGEQVELGGTFCMGKCQQGVCVTADDRFFSLSPQTVDDFFNTEVLGKV